MGTNNKNLTNLENLRFFIFPAYNKRLDSRFIIWAGVPPWEKLPAAPWLPRVNEENGVENDMKRKLMKAGAMALAIALFAACGSGDEPRNSTDAETETSRTETSAAARTPAPMPTRPKRIDHLLTPTAVAEPAKTVEPEAKQTGGDPTSNGIEKAVTGDPKTIAELVPEDPRTNDQVLLQDIYAQIDLEQFTLDPDQPIPWQGSKYDENSRVSVMPHPMIQQHPYLHLFPDLEAKVRRQRNGDVEYAPHSAYDRNRFKDISGIRNGLIYFIYNPWFEPVFPENRIRTPDSDANHLFFTSSNYYYNGAGPYWFGNNSVRGVLAETVAETPGGGETPLDGADPSTLVRRGPQGENRPR